MSILIKGIDMPEDDTMILLVGKRMVIEVADGFATPKRPIEWADVPTPHGRLIEAERLMHKLIRYGGISSWTEEELYYTIKDMDTIIEAEE